MTPLHVDPPFRALPDDPSRIIAASHDSIYIVDHALTIRACNDGYARFGNANGCLEVEKHHGMSRSPITVLSPAAPDMGVPAYREMPHAARGMGTSPSDDVLHTASRPGAARA